MAPEKETTSIDTQQTNDEITIDIDDSKNGEDTESVPINIDSGTSGNTVENYQNANGNVDGDGLRKAISDFTRSSDPISGDLLRKVIQAFAGG